MKKLPEGWVRVVGFPEMSPEQIERLKAVEASDEPINTSDIPELGEEFWRNAKRGRPVKSKPPRVEAAE